MAIMEIIVNKKDLLQRVLAKILAQMAHLM